MRRRRRGLRYNRFGCVFDIGVWCMYGWKGWDGYVCVVWWVFFLFDSIFVDKCIGVECCM